MKDIKKSLKKPLIGIIVLVSIFILYSLGWLLWYQFVVKPHISESMVYDEILSDGTWNYYGAGEDELQASYYLVCAKYPYPYGFSLDVISGCIGAHYDENENYVPQKNCSGSPYEFCVTAEHSIFGSFEYFSCDVMESPTSLEQENQVESVIYYLDIDGKPIEEKNNTSEWTNKQNEIYQNSLEEARSLAMESKKRMSIN